ncbi:potassium channel family protein [Phenylobacterium immobile]|uniref:potassium channel family protein n=1 Tax=Phenylobacterium immobile TaxID=21 RepID=UPI000AFCC937|nr:potassium channel family protein [Phenylobacterium immobile]
MSARRTPVRRGVRRLRARLRYLYHGQSAAAVRFRLAVIMIDIALIGFFIAAPLLRETPFFLAIDYFVAFILALDLCARALASRSLRTWAKRPIVWVDAFVLLTLLAPGWLFNLAFLRVLRLWTLLHSDFFWSTIGRRYDETRYEEVTRAASTLVTFVFIVTGFVYTSFAGRHVGVDGYIEALYFTVATLTTTGFGDIVLPGAWGKLISIVTMIAGITLFVRLAQTLFRPHKVRFLCGRCGLMRHEPDAVHCKACGLLLNIPNDEV